MQEEIVDVKSSIAFVNLINHHINQYRFKKDTKAVQVLRDLLVSAQKSNLVSKDQRIKLPRSEYGYEPYVGGAGPSKEIIKKNDKALMQALEDINVPFTYILHPAFSDEEVQFNVIRVCRKVNDILYISYDRWGYYIELKGKSVPVLDQSDFEDTLLYIQTWYNCSEPINIGENNE